MEVHACYSKTQRPRWEEHPWLEVSLHHQIRCCFKNPKNKKEKEIPESKEVGTVSEPNSPLHPPEVNLWSSPKYQVLRGAGRKLAEADDVTVSTDIFQLCFPLLHFLFCHRIN